MDTSTNPLIEGMADTPEGMVCALTPHIVFSQRVARGDATGDEVDYMHRLLSVLTPMKLLGVSATEI